MSDPHRAIGFMFTLCVTISDGMCVHWHNFCLLLGTSLKDSDWGRWDFGCSLFLDSTFNIWTIKLILEWVVDSNCTERSLRPDLWMNCFCSWFFGRWSSPSGWSFYVAIDVAHNINKSYPIHSRWSIGSRSSGSYRARKSCWAGI